MAVVHNFEDLARLVTDKFSPGNASLPASFLKNISQAAQKGILLEPLIDAFGNPLFLLGNSTLGNNFTIG
jgi:hypothetical protein